MIQLFDIKKRKNLKNNDTEIFDNYIKISQLSNEEILKKYNTNLEGLTTKQIKNLLVQNGKNVVVKDDKKSSLYFLMQSFKDEFIIILIVLAIINLFLKDKLGSLIIILIALISALIRFFQDYSVYKFNRKLKKSIYSTVFVIRNNQEVEVKVEDVVVGDIVKLNAVTIIPADIKILSSKDLFLNESVFTGESVLVEKYSNTKSIAKEIFSIRYLGLPAVFLNNLNKMSAPDTSSIEKGM